MNKAELHQIIEERYFVPLQRKRRDYVGIELELPVVRFGNLPVDLDVMQEMTERFMERFGFTKYRRDDNGRIYSAQDPVSGDDLSFDCSFNTPELSFGVESDMNRIYQRFSDYYTFMEDFLLPHGHTLTGMGVNPNYPYIDSIPIANGRYRMLFHHLSSAPKYPEKTFHSHPNFGMFSAASQVQLDVDTDNALLAINTFNRLEPFNSLLFANSYFREGKTRYYCSRDHLWADSLHGYNPRNLGMYECTINSFDRLADYIASESMYCLERDGKYYNFAPTPLEEYFAAESIPAEYWDGAGYAAEAIRPRPEDLAYHRSYKFEDLTFRGTIEFRSCCAQPAGEVMTVAAYFAGLMECLPELAELLEKDTSLYGHGADGLALRKIANTSGVPDFADSDAVQNTLLRILELADQGLGRRGYREERFLTPLYQRAEELENPAQWMEKQLAKGESSETLARRFAVM